MEDQNFLEDYLNSRKQFEASVTQRVVTEVKPVVEKKTIKPKKVKEVIVQPQIVTDELDLSAYLSDKDLFIDNVTEIINPDDISDRIVYQKVNLFNLLPNFHPLTKKKTIFEMTFEEEKHLAMAGKAKVLTHLLKSYTSNVSKDGINLFTPYPNKFGGELDPNNFMFYNTSLVSTAAKYFKKFNSYCDETPKSNPLRYKEFWDRWEFRRKYGMTLPIKGSMTGANSDNDLEEIWIPGKMVGMLNFAKITRTDTDGRIKKDANPMNFNLLLKDGLELQELRGVTDEDLSALFDQYSGNQVVDIVFDFPDFWDGHYMYWLSKEFSKRFGLNEATLKSRRKGFSIIGGWDAFDEIDMYPRKKVLLIAFLEAYLTSSNSMMKFIKDYHSFISLHTDWNKKTLVNNSTNLEYGYYPEGAKEALGFRSSVKCLTAKDNPSCARGSQANEIKYEECGSFPNVSETHEATAAAAESGGYTIGQETYWGTASTKDSEFGSFSKIIRNPKGNNILAYDWGLYEKKFAGKPTCMFFPQTLNYEGGGMDEHGNSLLTQSLVLYHDRFEWMKANKRPSEASKWQAERPIFPSQVLSMTIDNTFSEIANLITDQIDFLESEFNSQYTDGQYRVNADDKIELIPNSQLIREGIETHPFIYDTADFLPQDFDLHGCIREYEAPIVIRTPLGTTDLNGKPEFLEEVPEGIYVGWHDPYAVDKDKADITSKDSLGVTYIYMIANKYDKAAMGRVVASWIGRPPRTEDYNRALLLLCRRYNIKNGLLFENDRGEVLSDFKKWHALKHLAQEPMLASFKGTLGKATGIVYGMSIGKHPDRKSTGVRMLLDYLKTEILKQREDASAGIAQITIHRIKMIRCVRFLRELSKFNYMDNFDTVSSWIVGMFLLREHEDADINWNNQAVESNKRVGMAADDFFQRN